MIRLYYIILSFKNCQPYQMGQASFEGDHLIISPAFLIQLSFGLSASGRSLLLPRNDGGKIESRLCCCQPISLEFWKLSQPTQSRKRFFQCQLFLGLCSILFSFSTGYQYSARIFGQGLLSGTFLNYQPCGYFFRNWRVGILLSDKIHLFRCSLLCKSIYWSKHLSRRLTPIGRSHSHLFQI